MPKLFISHSSKDDAIVRELQRALADLGQDVWIDSRELLGGERLGLTIRQAIEDASAYAVVVSTDALQSKWVGKELRHALARQKQRGKGKYPVVPLSLDGTQLGMMEEFFDEEPIYVPISSAAGGVEAALNAILVALGKRSPAELTPAPRTEAEPLEELVLVLTDLKFLEQDGVRRASARARLVYEPATPEQPDVHSAQHWRFVAPLGPIEAGELRWYLEKFAVWPSHVFRDRARKVEKNLADWGTLLHAAAIPAAHTANVMSAWGRIDAHAGRRFSVYLDAGLEAGVPDTEVAAAREAAALLLGLPWELLHDSESFLFQGAMPTRVRRRLPNTRALDVPVVATPIRILLVTARPEDDACGYVDHRASALPLVDAMEQLGGVVRIHVLSPPTLPALREELDRARRAREPHHVVHFDGHGVYDRQVGLGGLCFEHPADSAKLDARRHLTVFTDELGPLLRDHRIPLVFLEACQTAQAEQASESVASEMLKTGVASVVAMSHSVLVETARRFVAAFYASLARGARVGDAVLEGQRTLKDDTLRGRVFGAGELRLEDWFVPVLFQEKEDPQLFRATPARQTQEDLKALLSRRLGELPDPPETGFVGRSRELLALERLLRRERYAVILGQGGEGKTALAAEFARWMVRSQQIRRAAFVSVETHGNLGAMLDTLGHQLVNKDYSVAAFENLDEAIQPVERALAEQPTLLVVDNMESVLLPPYIADDTPQALSEEARHKLTAILALCVQLNTRGDTRLVFTSREELPSPFDRKRHRRELHRLNRDDAVKLLERVLSNDAAATGDAADAAREAIEQLVDAVHGHARTLALLAPALRRHGVEKTRTSLVELMAEMERRFPGSREQSLFASVELSLRRLSPANLDRVRVLGVFHGAVHPGVLGTMMAWELADVASLAGELIETGLASRDAFNHLTLNPALCPYLLGRLDAAEREVLEARWVREMRGYAVYLTRQQSQSAELAATMTVLELPNLFALLDHVQRAGDAAATIDLATSLYALLQTLGKPRLLEHVAQVRDAAAAALDDAWKHARFEAEHSRIEQQRVSGGLSEALNGARVLLQRARAAGEEAYPGADYDLATACFLLARISRTTGSPEQALPLLDEARQRGEAVAKDRPGQGSEVMAYTCIAEQGACFLALGHLDEAAGAYEDAVCRAKQRGDDRGVAVGKGQLGAICMHQRRYEEALAAYEEARERFTRLGEAGSVADAWHLTGMAYQAAGQSEAAEDAYRKALRTRVQLGNVRGQADTLLQLGNLYSATPERQEDAVTLYKQAASKFFETGHAFGEGVARNNLGLTLHRIRRLDEARLEILRTIACKQAFGNTSESWLTWATLAAIEADAGNPADARQANRNATACYLAYRRDGGENHNGDGRLCLTVTQHLEAGDADGAAILLEELAADSDLPKWFRPFVDVLQAIVGGSRDPSLVDAPDLHYRSAAELLFLIEKLNAPR